MNITFIGGGNMATALIGGLLAQGRDPAHMNVVELSPAARERLEGEYRVRTWESVELAAVRDADLILLAVKPQQMRAAALSLAGCVAGQLVVTLAAGIRLADLSRWLGGYRSLVRVMPNTPALIRQGVSGLYALPGVTEAQRTLAQDLLSAVGETLWCEREELLDAVTAVSGSGPAYVFYFMESLEAAARALGFSAADARTLAYTTFSGAVELARQSSEEPSTLRARVTSKGGTTERALAQMETGKLKEVIVAAVKAADARAHELGDEFGRG
jgi:pyrroline-5-carboxylate reductase